MLNRRAIVAAMRRSSGWAAVGPLLAALLLPACRPANPSTTVGDARPARPAIELVHWLGTGDEAAALAVIRTRFVAEGGSWRDTAMPGVAAAQSTTVNRILGGNPPSIFQTSIGAPLGEMRRLGLVSAAPNTWIDGRGLLPLLEADAKVDGEYVAVPAMIRGENWMFFNRRVLARHGLSAPESWPDLLRAARQLKAEGATPIALGGQPWQERILFNAVLLGTAGPGVYRAVYVDRVPGAATSRQVLHAFEIMAELRDLVDEQSPGRSWQDASRMLARGEAAFQFTGDWAKAVFRAGGVQLDGEIGCVLAPGTTENYIVAVDAFAFPSYRDSAEQAGQRLFARVVLSPEVQSQIAERLGSVPVVADLKISATDPCVRKALAIDPEGYLPSTGLYVLPAGLSGAVDDAIAQFWHARLSAAEGHKLFVAALAAYGRERV